MELQLNCGQITEKNRENWASKVTQKCDLQPKSPGTLTNKKRSQLFLWSSHAAEAWALVPTIFGFRACLPQLRGGVTIKSAGEFSGHASDETLAQPSATIFFEQIASKPAQHVSCTSKIEQFKAGKRHTSWQHISVSFRFYISN